MPGFHSWFLRKIALIFQNQVVGKALDCLRLDIRFTANSLAVMHKIQEKKTAQVYSA